MDVMDVVSSHRKDNMKKVIAVLVTALALSGCGSDADVASENLSKAADNFEIERRIVFFNGITDTYLMTIEGRCSLGNRDNARRLTVTCKVGEGKYKKHFLGLSDNVSYFVEQTKAERVSAYHYRITFKPSVIVPDIDYRTENPSEKVDS
jgi:hypothetical protein